MEPFSEKKKKNPYTTDFRENLYPSASMKIGSHLHKLHSLQQKQRNTRQIMDGSMKKEEEKESDREK